LRPVRARDVRLVLLGGALFAASARGAPRTVDARRSSVSVHVGKSGVFSAFGDEHDVRAPILRGTVEDGPQPSVDLTIDARGMTVLDPNLAAGKRAEVQKKMLSAEVLDVERHPEIRFRSTAVTAAGEGRWRVEGELELRGRKGPLTFDVTARDGRVKGTARLSQRAFGIEPVSAGGGTVKVKDELRIDFDVVTLANEGG
jgi:polyisoprenoid-binding protein YceI